MLPIRIAQEPSDFDGKVRKRGLAWLRSHNIQQHSVAPRGLHIPDYWLECKSALRQAAGYICSYYAIYIFGGEVDHFVPKSLDCDLAYEWTNYRFASSEANKAKGSATDVMDPAKIQPETFLLNIMSGEIRPNEKLDDKDKLAAELTIARLKLNSPLLIDRRLHDFDVMKSSSEIFATYSPFVYYEAVRQKVLKVG